MDNKTKVIVYIMRKATMKSYAFRAEIDAIEDLYERYNIKSVIYYKWDEIEYKSFIQKLEKFWILFRNYSNKEELKENILDLNKESDIIFISTPLEFLVNLVNEIKLLLWRCLSDNPDIFRDKYLQRKLIGDHNSELWVKYLKWFPSELNIDEIEEKVGYPFMIKPVDWVESLGVDKIDCKEEFESYMKNYENFHEVFKGWWIDNKVLIVEEFIDWQLYSIDYFVSDDWFISVSKPIKVRLWIDIWIDDYFNMARISTEKTQREFKWKRLKTFINSTVKACWIRNTFVHHEFKLNSNWYFKTIELNWRIGWWRLAMIKQSYDFNLFEFIVNKEATIWTLKMNNIAINIYSTERWILKSFNNKLFKKIEKKTSVYRIELFEKFIWKEVWLTRNWFTKIWVIGLKGKDYKEIRKDYLYVKKNYKKLIELEWVVN